MENQTAEKKKGGFHYGYLIIISCICLCFGPVAFAISCAGIFFSPVSKALGIGAGMASNYLSMTWVASMIFLPIMGKWLKNKDVRVVATFGACMIILALVLNSFVSSFPMFLIDGFISGLGITIIMFLMPSTMMNRWFAKRTGFWIGVIFAFTGIGGVVWSPIIGSIINASGYQSAYLMEALLAAIFSLPFTIFVLRSEPKDKGILPWGADASGATSVAKVEDTGMDTKSAVKTKPFVLMGIAVLISSMAMYTQVMLAPYAANLPLVQTMPLLGATLLSVLFAGATITKLFLGGLADKNLKAAIFLPIICGCAGAIGMVAGTGSFGPLAVSAFLCGMYTAHINIIYPLMTTYCFGRKNYVTIYSRIGSINSLGSILQGVVLGTLADTVGQTSVYFTMIGIMVVSLILLLAAHSAGKKVRAQWADDTAAKDTAAA